jgi:hypothetical protein
MRSPREIATWRYEQIAPFLDATLSSADQRRAMKDRCAREVVWPNGKKKRISKSTLHRWIRAFAAGGYLALMPTPRSDRGKPRRDTEVWIDHAIALLLEQPKRSLFQLESYLKLEFEEYRLGRSTLSRHLHAHPAYRLIEKLRGKRPKQLRGLYEAKHPHESWQLDGKGPFRVRLMSGERIFVHVLTVLDDFARHGGGWPREHKGGDRGVPEGGPALRNTRPNAVRSGVRIRQRSVPSRARPIGCSSQCRQGEAASISREN